VTWPLTQATLTNMRSFATPSRKSGLGIIRRTAGWPSLFGYAIGLLALMTIQTARGADPLKVPMTADRWTTTAGTVEFVEHLGIPSMELKPGNYASAHRIGRGGAERNDLSQRDD
jgi:hypothetical protein